MGRYTGPKNKIARKFGINLGLKTNPAKVARRLSQPPGVHGPKKRIGASSSYGKQLFEKQKAKYIYGLREEQMLRYINEATRQKGDSGQHVLSMLESRMDNVIYRLGFAVTRAQARQMVTHNLFAVNEKKMNIPSYLVKVGDVITIKPNKAKKKIFEGLEERLSKKDLPSWLTVDAAAKSGKVISKPQESDLEKIFDIKLIIEFYSSR